MPPAPPEPAPPQTALSWLHAVCTSSLGGVWATASYAEISSQLHITLGAKTLRLSPRPPDDHPSWLARPGLLLNVDTESPITAELQQRLRELRAALERAPLGDLSWPPPSTGVGALPGAPPPRSSAASPAGWRAHPLSKALDAELNECAWMALQLFEHDPRSMPTILRHDGARVTPWRTLVLAETYPYPSVLGEPLSRATLLDGWRHTVAQIGLGRAPHGVDVYLHVPYCTTHCHFCYCAVSTEVSAPELERYVDALLEELQQFGAVLAGVPVRTVYLGGGTPSLLSARQLERLFQGLHTSLDAASSAQVTVETNPDSLTGERLEALVRYAGLSRLTIGIQSLEPEAQRRAQRFNEPERIRRLVQHARQLGVPQLHLDVMAGMDGQTLEGFQRDVEFALSLAPTSLHLSTFRPVHPVHLRADPEQILLRRLMLEWGRRRLAEQGLASTGPLPASAEATDVNQQLDGFHQADASLLGVGVSAFSHAYGTSFYEQPYDLQPSLLRLRRGQPALYRGLLSNEQEELHRLLVHGLFNRRLSLPHFRRLFRREPWDAAPDAWQKLTELGVVERAGELVRFRLPSYADVAILRGLFYSPEVRARVRARWAGSYRRHDDYRARVDALAADSE